jgi:hypothetical protein
MSSCSASVQTTKAAFRHVGRTAHGPNKRLSAARSSGSRMLKTRHVVFALSLILAPCELLAQCQPWSFVRSVGGVRLGIPIRQGNGTVILPVEADVSGLKHFSVTPTALNAGLVCSKWRARVTGFNVSICVETSLPMAGATDSRCPSTIDLGDVKTGGYGVAYVGPDNVAQELGRLNVP